MAQSPILGPGADETSKKAARIHELFGMGMDPSNCAGLLVIGSVLLLVALSKSFGGLTVSVS